TEIKAAFDKVVAARILSVRPHPNADKLTLCETSTGKESFTVVCGAPNVYPGAVVPLAMVGATIPGGYTIKLSAIRGERSEGMLCSEEELGIGSDNSGIMILPEELPLGEDLAKALDLEDVVLDIGVTPNRADCLSIIGVAREIAAITGKRLRYPRIVLSEVDRDIHEISSVTILDPELCPRYSARMIQNVRIGPSPLWMRQRLEAVGLRAINNIVDITNFVMMELGQPLHAFDYRFLEEGRIVVRKAVEGESFVSLDEKERRLRDGTLLICDGVKPVAIAGIMGGLNSEVKEDTAVVFLESAYFNPSSIRRSSRWLGMSTDAAFRFERGIDPEGVIRALNRAAQLMSDLAQGEVFRNVIDQYPKRVETAKDIPLRPRRVNEILGTDIGADEMLDVLHRLEMQVLPEKPVSDLEVYRVTPLTCRVDVVREIDLVEEIARFHGYDRIPVTVPAASAMPDLKERRKIVDERIRAVVAGCGFSEVITYSFISPASADQLNLKAEDERRRFVRIRNPLTEDQSVMRTQLTYSLLNAMRDNARTGCFNLKIFEIGKVFIDRGEGELPRERDRLGMLLTGQRYDDLWHFKDFQADFYDLKGCLENILYDLKIGGLMFRSGSSSQPFLHPGRSCDLVTGDQILGFIGEVHPDVQAAMDLKNKAMILEMDLELLTAHFKSEILYRVVSKYPSVTRDTAFIVRQDLEAGEVVRIAFEEGEELLDNIHVFDVYTGKGIADGVKSLGLRFSYRSSEKTLTDEEVNRVHRGIIKRITNLTGARIRGEDQ
ncbi:MAG: phenylalanine--tRNA ligase subunit beta, partial [Deltaproteobacteria bacterium]|nr:phenylalanine--tRNA ligase subunit beta [Deltaproteobacteria bacterium]